MRFPGQRQLLFSAVRELHPALDATIDNLFGSSSGELKEGVTTFQARAPPIFCLTCFEELHKLHICWTCGLTVVREEERVGCGWAWWHWGCVSCLLCRVRPPCPADPPFSSFWHRLPSQNTFQISRAANEDGQAPVRPPAWTSAPITLSDSPRLQSLSPRTA